MRCKWLIAAVMLLLAATGRAQELMPYVWRNYIEMLSEEGEDETAEEMMELFAECQENRVNVNDTAVGLSVFPFVSEFQRNSLRVHILLYGQLLSMEELYDVNGFDSTTVEMLRPVAKAGIVEERESVGWKDLFKRGRSNFVTGVGGTVEQARGYRDSIYEGNNMRVMWRYVYKYKERVQLQLSGDKDPGEAFFAGSQRKGFDFYGYSLMINDIGRYAEKERGRERNVYVKRLVLGQYHAQFGQGLTMWSGYGWRSVVGTSICRIGQGVRPNGAFMEYGYLRGGAATLQLARSWQMTAFYSFVDRDATLPRGGGENAEPRVQSIYNSGYHRTQTEIGKKGQLGEHLLGGHIEYRVSELSVGLTGVAMLLDKTIVPATYVYNDNAFVGRRNYNAGVDFRYRYRNVLLFGEAAVCVNKAADTVERNVSPAALLGCEYVINNNHRVSGLARYYSERYHNLHSNAIGQNSSPQNEIGCGIQYRGRLPLGIDALATADWFYFPHMKYLVYGPSRGQDYRLTLSRGFSGIEGLTVNVRYRYNDKGRNITPSTMVDGKYLMEQVYRHQIQADVVYERGGWKFVSRAAYALYYGEVTERDRGWLLYQDVQYQAQRIPLTAVVRVSWCDVDDYEARIYAVENDFIYQSNSMVYQNEGFRCYLLLRYDIKKWWNIGIKYGITGYVDKDSFGSGYELIEGNHRQQWRVQMRLKW